MREFLLLRHSLETKIVSQQIRKDDYVAVDSKPSIREVAPIEVGGVVARKGFSYQDHVAASFCLKMLDDLALIEVWCETHDDITLIWRSKDEETVEFVQVKTSHLDQLWTVNTLCSKQGRTSKSNGAAASGSISKSAKSILEKSLSNDRVREPCRFRLVTTRGMAKDLGFLGLPFTSPTRVDPPETFQDLCDSIDKKLGGFTSSNGRGARYWLENTTWDVIASNKHVESANLLRLSDAAQARGAQLAPDQRQNLYDRILHKVKRLAESEWHEDPSAKKLTCAQFNEWLNAEVEKISQAVVDGSSETLRRKMQNAGLDYSYAQDAAEARRRYLRWLRDTRFLELDDKHLISAEVQSRLRRLKIDLDTREIADSGPMFHSRCIDMLSALREAHDTDWRVTLDILDGCMYEITNRCIHRFHREEP